MKQNSGGITPDIMRKITPAAGGFATPDGALHPRWGDARQHLTMLDVRADIVACSGPRLTDVEVARLADYLFARWRLSRR